MYKHDGNLRTGGKCRKHELQASVFCINVDIMYTDVCPEIVNIC